MDHHHTQQLNYRPRGLYNDEGYLMVCGAHNHKIHRYRYDGQMLAVINLTCNVKPGWVTRDRDQYVVSDGWYDRCGSRGGGGARPPLFVPNSLKSPLNWPKFVKKACADEPPKPLRSLLFKIPDPPLV